MPRADELKAIVAGFGNRQAPPFARIDERRNWARLGADRDQEVRLPATDPSAHKPAAKPGQRWGKAAAAFVAW